MAKPKLVYHYHQVTGEYLNTSSEADRDPMTPGAFLVPAHATIQVPPSVSNPKTDRAVFRDGKWLIELKPLPPKPTIRENMFDAPRGNLFKGPLIMDVLTNETVDRGN